MRSTSSTGRTSATAIVGVLCVLGLSASAARSDQPGSGVEQSTLGAEQSTSAAPGAPSPAPTGEQSAVSLRAALIPERLGASTTIEFGFTVTAAPGLAPAPIRRIDLFYPENLGVATTGLGLASCGLATLESRGPPGCPRNSIIGYGTGLVEVPFGPEILRESVRTTTFAAPIHEGKVPLLFYAEGESPVWAQIVFPGLILPAAAPFGGDLSTSLPLVPTLPGAPAAALVQFTTTLGPSHVTYYEYRRGRLVAYQPEGILLPPTCPRGGFRFGAAFYFEGGAEAATHALVPCPRLQRSRRHRRVRARD